MNHNHQHDRAYKNVILHVVYHDDQTIENDISVLELNGRINGMYLRNFERLMLTKASIPCVSTISKIQDFVWFAWKERLAVERMERKTNEIDIFLQKNNGDWPETFYQFIARSLGMKHNALPMEWLAKSLPLQVLMKHRNSLFQLEALFLGQAGFLENNTIDTMNEYIKQLQTEYLFLSKKFKLTPLDQSVFKTGGVRPPNQPTIRIAQLAQIVFQSQGLFRFVVEAEEPKRIMDIFAVELHDFWTNRYALMRTSKRSIKKIGKTTIQSILINSVVPFLFHYGKCIGNARLTERAFELLSTMKAETNSIIDLWRTIGEEPKSAFDSQSLIELKNEYCNKKKCLSCAVGHELLRQE